MNRIKAIVKVSFATVLAVALILLFYPGWKFSAGVIIGGLVSIGDFILIAKTMAMLKISAQDPKIMLRFGMIFVAKTFVLLLVLAGIIYLFKLLNAKMSLFGFVCGLFAVPFAIVATAFRKRQD